MPVMEIITDAALIERIKAFIDQHQMAPTRFGREAMGDGALLSQLEDGRSLSLKNAEKVIRYMQEYRAGGLAA
jgi:hypothetical protein